MVGEIGKGTSIARVYMFRDPDGLIAKLGRSGVPAEKLAEMYQDRLIGVKEVRGNVFLNEGIQFIWKAVTGQSGLTYFGSNSCIGVGDGTTAADPSQTGLTGSNKLYKQVDSGYPQLSGNSVIFQATFGGSEAVFTWNEWTIANGCDDTYVNLNRKQETLGTKASGATWILQVQLTIS
jgi:hypothetical protein